MLYLEKIHDEKSRPKDYSQNDKMLKLLIVCLVGRVK